MTNDPCPHCGYCPHCKRSTRDFAPYVPYLPPVLPQPWVYPYWQHPITVTCGNTTTTAPLYPNTTTWFGNTAAAPACVGTYAFDSANMSYEYNPTLPSASAPATTRRPSA